MNSNREGIGPSRFWRAAIKNCKSLGRLDACLTARLRPGLAVLLSLLLCGCFKSKDELTLEPDGSGTVRLETQVLNSPEALSSLGLGMRMGGSEPIMYPPLTEQDARRLFPSKDFKVTVKTEKSGNAEQLVITEASFKDVNALLASPYARAHGLWLKIDGGKLLLKAVSGIEAAARLADTKDEGGFLGEQMPGFTDLLKRKDELRHEFRITLPGPVAAASGARDGRTVTWTLDRAKQTNAAEFVELSGRVLEASCPADGLKLNPITPPRLALGSFKDVPTGEVAAKGAGPDAAKVKAASKFVPYALQVTRSLDLSGEGGAPANQAQLFGAMVLPHEFAPQKWGQVKIEEVVDAKGNSLLIAGEREGFPGVPRFTDQLENDEEEGEAGEKPAAAPTEARKFVTLRFQPPDWKVKEITRLKATMTLQYLGGAQHIVKLTNAVPTKWIREMKKGMEEDFDMDAERALSHPALPELGVTLGFQMGMAQSGFTMLMLQVGGNKGVLTEAQVFDSTGRPWPTFMQLQSFGDAGSCSISVAGRPTPPLSLALLVTGVGADIELPIVLEKVPVGRP